MNKCPNPYFFFFFLKHLSVSTSNFPGKIMVTYCVCMYKYTCIWFFSQRKISPDSLMTYLHEKIYLRKTRVQRKPLFSCVWHTQFTALDIYIQCMAVKQRQNIRVIVEWDFKHWEACRQDKAQLLLILSNIHNLGLVCKYRK